jgi:hypothetical protein
MRRTRTPCDRSRPDRETVRHHVPPRSVRGRLFPSPIRARDERIPRRKRCRCHAPRSELRRWLAWLARQRAAQVRCSVEAVLRAEPPPSPPPAHRRRRTLTGRR